MLSKILLGILGSIAFSIVAGNTITDLIATVNTTDAAEVNDSTNVDTNLSSIEAAASEIQKQQIKMFETSTATTTTTAEASTQDQTATGGASLSLTAVNSLSAVDGVTKFNALSTTSAVNVNKEAVIAIKTAFPEVATAAVTSTTTPSVARLIVAPSEYASAMQSTSTTSSSFHTSTVLSETDIPLKESDLQDFLEPKQDFEYSILHIQFDE